MWYGFILVIPNYLLKEPNVHFQVWNPCAYDSTWGFATLNFGDLCGFFFLWKGSQIVCGGCFRDSYLLLEWTFHSWRHTFRKKGLKHRKPRMCLCHPISCQVRPSVRALGFRILGLLPTCKCKIFGFFRIWWSYKCNCINIYIYCHYKSLYMSKRIQCIYATPMGSSNKSLSTKRQLLRIKTGAAALESLTFADVEAKKLADSVEEVPHLTSLGFSRWMAFGWFFFNEASVRDFFGGVSPLHYEKLMKVALEFLWGARKSWGLGMLINAEDN